MDVGTQEGRHTLMVCTHDSKRLSAEAITQTRLRETQVSKEGGELHATKLDGTAQRHHTLV